MSLISVESGSLAFHHFMLIFGGVCNNTSINMDVLKGDPKITRESCGRTITLIDFDNHRISDLGQHLKTNMTSPFILKAPMENYYCYD